MSVFGKYFFPVDENKTAPNILVSIPADERVIIPGGAVFDVVAIRPSAFSIGGGESNDDSDECPGGT